MLRRKSGFYAEAIVPIPLEENEFLILIQLSNYQQARGGFFFPLSIGGHDEVLTAALREYVSMVYCSAYCSSLVSTISSSTDSDGQINRLFTLGILTLVTAIREAIMGHTLGTLRLIDDPLILYRIEYATIALGMPLIALYVIKLIEREQSNDKIAYALTGIGGILLLCCVTLDVYSIMSILNLYQLFIAATVLYLIQHLWFAMKERGTR